MDCFILVIKCDREKKKQLFTRLVILKNGSLLVFTSSQWMDEKKRPSKEIVFPWLRYADLLAVDSWSFWRYYGSLTCVCVHLDVN